MEAGVGRVEKELGLPQQTRPTVLGPLGLLSVYMYRQYIYTRSFNSSHTSTSPQDD